MTQYVNSQTKGNFQVITFTGLKNLDASTAERVRAEIRGAMSAQAVNVIIDFTNINFVDSTGFGMLISILKVVKANQGRLILSGISKEIIELMDLMQLLSVFEMQPTLQDAEKALN